MATIGSDFERETGHRVTVSFAGSSLLARQIGQGAPADIFISANPGWMDWLQARGQVEPGTRFDLAGNRLVLVGHGAGRPAWPDVASADIVAALNDRPLAMALVDAVPAGQYGQAALQTVGQWDRVADHVVQTDNVRAALALVVLGEAPLGIVYRSDARAEPRVSILATFPTESHPPIQYPAALVAGHPGEASRAFLDYLRGPAARDALREQGFIVDGP